MLSWSDHLAARAISLAVAIALDAVLGDPPNRVHPVAWLGSLIGLLDRRLRTVRALSGRTGGAILMFATVSVGVGVSAALSISAWRVSPFAGIIADALLVWFAVSTRSLAHAGGSVAAALEAGDLVAARERVSHLVARRCDGLDDPGVARAAVESLSENVVDGVVAPLFWAATAGPAGAWLHKAASTLDSMVGYRCEPYARFGTASARLDDVLAWVPARLTIAIVALAAWFVGLDGRAAWRVGLRDRRHHSSPNSAHGEAAFAGALHVRLGGPVEYPDGVHERLAIGAEGAEPDAHSTLAATRLVRATGVIAGMFGIVTLVVAQLMIGR